MLIRRYITHQVSKMLLIVLAVLLFIFLSMQWMDFLGDVVEGKLSVGTVLRLMGLQAPYLFGLLLPLSFFLGVLLTHGRLNMDHEMMALYACGLSKRRLSGFTLRQAGLIGVLTFVFVVFLQPEILKAQDRVLVQANQNAWVESLVPGQFQTLGKANRILYTESMSADHQRLEKVFVASPPQQGAYDVMTAKQASMDFEKALGGVYLIFEQGQRYQALDDAQYAMAFDRYGLRLQAGVEAHKKDYDPSRMKMSALWQDKTHPALAMAEFHWRLALPISVLVFAVAGLVFTPLNPRTGRFARLLPALLFYVVYMNCLFAGSAWIKQAMVPLVVGLWWVPLLALSFCGLMRLRRSV